MKKLVGAILAVSILAACAPDEPASDGAGTTTVKVVTHDSFSASEAVLDEFAKESGIKIELVPSGDAGEMVNKSVLTAGNPLGDVMFGVDNTFLSRALEADLFVPHESPALRFVPDELEQDAQHRVTPVTRGDVCVNYDKSAFSESAPPPSTLAELADPRFKDQFVVENPATSSPGLAFLLATVERFGDPGWEKYWLSLKENGVRIAAGWEEAYNAEFSGGAGEGTRPLVVSYASSPPAEVHFSETPGAEPTTAVMEDGCFRQVEFAGVLRGSKQPEAAGKVIDFFLSEQFQADMPLNMFVFPTRDKVELPEVFERYAAQPKGYLSTEPQEIEKNRERWLSRWTELMLG